MDLPLASAPAIRPYRPNVFWARATTGLLAASIGVDAMTLLAQAWLRSALRHGEDLRAMVPSALDSLQLLLSGLDKPLNYGIELSFLVWIYRAFANLPALGSTRREIAPGQSATPRTAVISWFIPILSLVWGYRSVRHLWRESQLQRVKLDDGTVLGDDTPLLGWWWGVYIVRGLSFMFAGFALLSSLHSSSSAQQLWIARTNVLIVPTLLDIASAYLCIRVVGGIAHRQEEQQRDLLLRVPAPPATDHLR